VLTVAVTPGTNPTSTALSVTADLSSIVQGDTAHPFQAGANDTFTLGVTVDASATPGTWSLPITVADGYGRSSGFTIPLTVTPPLAHSTVVISQLYGGGGNAGATYKNDYVQLYNRGTTAVDLAGWTIQYGSATGTSWSNKQPLGGVIAPGEYYLIALGAGTAGDGIALPAANISGEINMGASAGKLALVQSGDTLPNDKCPIGANVRDFVGYGSANCSEGSPAPGAGNTSAIFRQGGGFIDSNDNAADFIAGPPVASRTAPIMEIGPAVLSTDPTAGATAAPRDATIDVTFTEPVDVLGAWYDVACSQTGPHNDATTAVAHNGKDHYITPNVNFQAGETCTVTVFQNGISDQDLDDSAPNTDHLPSDYSWSFTVAAPLANSFQPPYGPDVHLAMGSPSDAAADVSHPNDYLMTKAEYALSYNRDLGRPNWVSWHLSPEWFGSLSRVDTFRADPQVPADWYRVQSFSFEGSGFDRGHMTPNADRDLETSIPINQATYLMSNMIAQAPDNNQGPWAHLENYLRAQLGTSHTSPIAEAYVVSGPAGVGGIGDNGYRETIDNGHVTVPAYTWKVALILPFSTDDDVARVNCDARTIAVIMPNIDHIGTGASDDWMPYLTTVDAVEALTGFDLFSNVPAAIQNCIQAGINGHNPKSQVISFPPIVPHHFGDPDFAATATSSSNLPVTLVVVSGPATIVNGLVHITGAGSVTLRATQPGNVDPNPNTIGNTFAKAVPVEQTFAVEKGTPVFTALSSPSIEAGTASVPVSGLLSLNGIAPARDITIAVGSASTTAPIGPDGSFSGSLATTALDATHSPYTIDFTFAGDANFTSATASSSLTVVDTTAPAIGPMTASPNVLGPPNHKMVNVTVNYTVSEDLSGPPMCTLSVQSNEPANGTGDGNTAVDWIVGDAHHLQLRAERAGTGSGRLYTITATCTDASHNAASTSTTVAVPK
jgi:endonuclease G